MKRTCFKYLDYKVTDETSPFHVPSRSGSSQPIRFRGLIHSFVQYLSKNPQTKVHPPPQPTLDIKKGDVCAWMSGQLILIKCYVLLPERKSFTEKMHVT